MSWLTKCNYCGFRDVGSRAAQEGKFVKKVKSDFMMGGWDIHVVGLKEEPSQDNWVAWMMAIPRSCEC